MLGIAGGITGAVVLGLLVGSFLNVVIYRLPIKEERDWRRAIKEYFGVDVPPVRPNPVPDDQEFSLHAPRSRCTGCGAQIKAWQKRTASQLAAAAGPLCGLRAGDFSPFTPL